MNAFLRSFSYIFHPLFIPIGGTLAYFLITPTFVSLEQQSGNILPIFILTVIIPIIFFLILKNLGLISSIFTPSLKERRYPLVIGILLNLMVVYKVIPQNYIHEIYFFFVGLIIALTSVFLLLFLKVKTSVHLLGMSSLMMFLIGLSIHFEVNITFAIALITICTGLVATSRLYMKAHSKTELLIGVLIGFTSQLVLLRYWL